MSDDTERAGSGEQGSSETGQPELERPYDASDPEVVQQRKRDVGRRQRQNRDVLRNLMSSPQGRAWAWDTLSMCHIFATSFQHGINGLSIAFSEGERNVGLKLNADLIAADPKAYVLMQAENGKGL